MGVNKTSSQSPPRKSWRRIARRSAVAAVFLIFAVSIVWLLVPHETKTERPVSLDQADRCPIPLPATARNIQYYTHYQFNFFCEFVRFEAPVDDCKSHVDVVRNVWREQFDYLLDEFEPLSRLMDQPSQQLFAEKHGVTWFDPHNIQEGLTAGGGGSGVPMIWIDTQRGVFYYKITD